MVQTAQHGTSDESAKWWGARDRVGRWPPALPRGPLVMGVTKEACTEDSGFRDDCRLNIALSGGKLTEGQRGAVWWANLP